MCFLGTSPRSVNLLYLLLLPQVIRTSHSLAPQECEGYLCSPFSLGEGTFDVPKNHFQWGLKLNWVSEGYPVSQLSLSSWYLDSDGLGSESQISQVLTVTSWEPLGHYCSSQLFVCQATGTRGSERGCSSLGPMLLAGSLRYVWLFEGCTLFFLLIFIYLFDCTGCWLQHVGSCFFFLTYSMGDLQLCHVNSPSCGIRDLVPWQGSSLGPLHWEEQNPSH